MRDHHPQPTGGRARTHRRCVTCSAPLSDYEIVVSVARRLRVTDKTGRDGVSNFPDAVLRRSLCLESDPLTNLPARDGDISHIATEGEVPLLELDSTDIPPDEIDDLGLCV